jgi:hypothetical protein
MLWTATLLYTRAVACARRDNDEGQYMSDPRALLMRRAVNQATDSLFASVGGSAGEYHQRDSRR